MKLLYRSYDRPLSITDALEFACDGSDYERGELETIKATVNELTEIVGQMLEVLHSS